MKTILITGACGFLGTRLTQTLLDTTEHRVVAVAMQPEHMRQTFSAYGDRVTVIGIEDVCAWNWAEVDVLLHAAFPRNAANGAQMAQGLSFLNRVLVAAVNGGVKAVVHISSQSVYSQSRSHAADEHEPPDLESKYAIGKYAVELMTDSLCAALPHTNLRMASLIGVGFDQRITNKFVAQAMAGNDLHIVGGEQRFGFLDVRDAVSGIVAVLNSDPAMWESVYNLGVNDSYTLAEIAETVCELSKTYAPQAVAFTRENGEAVQNSALDCSRFMKAFAWTPQYTLEDTVRTIFEAEKK